MELTEDEKQRIGHLYYKAVQLTRQKGRLSYSLIQRRLRIGYFAADRCVQAMERNGVISPADNLGRREVYPENDKLCNVAAKPKETQ